MASKSLGGIGRGKPVQKVATESSEIPEPPTAFRPGFGSGGSGSGIGAKNSQFGFGSGEGQRAGGGQKRGGCFTCGQDGHQARDCPDKDAGSGGFGGGGDRRRGCYKCGEDGHISRDCPNAGAQKSGGFGGGEPSGGGFAGFGDSSGGGGGGGFGFGGGQSGGGFGGGQSGGGFGGGQSGGGFGGGFQSEFGFDQEKPARDNKCRKCGEEGHMARDCSLPDKCRKCSEEGHLARDCSLPDKCRKCNEEGHLARDCSLPDKCGNCHQEGHTIRDCTLPLKCRRCQEEGHLVRECPQPMTCYNCGEEGHLGKACDKPRKEREGGDGESKPPVDYIPEEEPDVQKLYAEHIPAGAGFDNFFNVSCQVSNMQNVVAIESFEGSGLDPRLVENVRHMGFERPTPVQMNAIPAILKGFDLLASAQTGSGKTVAFLLPILNELLKEVEKNGGAESEEGGGKAARPMAVVVAPTRELAVQLNNEARKLCASTKLRPGLLYGGVKVSFHQTKMSAGVDVLLGTPGRTLQFIDDGLVSLENVKFVVFDEADRLLDEGFEPEMRRLMESKTLSQPSVRQTLMLSATFPDELQGLAEDLMGRREHAVVKIGEVGAANTDISQKLYEVKQEHKKDKLLELLREDISAFKMDEESYKRKTLVFVERKRNADALASILCDNDFPATTIHGDRTQKQREEALAKFRIGACPLLVATQVAARGLDIIGVDHVINYDLPQSIEDYVHRIGRTGRIGNPGRSTSFYDSDVDESLIPKLLKVLKGAQQVVPQWMEKANETEGFQSAGEKDGWD